MQPPPILTGLRTEGAAPSHRLLVIFVSVSLALSACEETVGYWKHIEVLIACALLVEN